jgi:3-deoxy-D-manno-octulosonate 8-phosphate phosphatase (KDO 8-P phosphatase)
MDKELIERAKKIKLILLDCDGVLTDGRLHFGENGEIIKTFHVRDGQGIVTWHKAGFVSGIISGRNSKIVERRGNELGIRYIRQGSSDKLEDFAEVLSESGYTAEEAAYIGDDIPDIELLKAVGLSFTVADAAEEVFSNVDIILKKTGGNGAVREMIDYLINAKMK